MSTLKEVLNVGHGARHRETPHPNDRFTPGNHSLVLDEKRELVLRRAKD